MPMRIVAVPEAFPPKWDLADRAPEGADLAALLAGATAVATAPPRLMPFVTTAAELATRVIPPREMIVTPFLPLSSLSMIYAARGVGKTWFALSMCLAIAHGDDFLTYAVPKPRSVLYIDGEMALADLQDRVRGLAPQPPDNLLLLPSESLFREDRPLNINDSEDQTAIEEAIEALRMQGRCPDVVVLDNLSSLSGGVDENDNSTLDALLRWLTSLRHKGFAVVLVHHAGKSGDQRGASRREDLLDTSIRLSRPKEEKGKEDEEDLLPKPDGAFFEVEFVKTRGRMPNPAKFNLILEEGPNGVLEWLASQGESATAKDKVLRVIALDKPSSQKVIADKLALSKGAISQHCTALRKAGYIEGELSLTEPGRQRLLELWPKLSQRLEVQDDMPF